MREIAEYLPTTIHSTSDLPVAAEAKADSRSGSAEPAGSNSELDSSSNSPVVEARINRAKHRRDIDALDRAILEIAHGINAANYEFLCLVREFDERAGWLKWGLSSCAEWLHWRCDIGLSAAREKVRVAHAIKVLPITSEVFCDGNLSYSKVRAITRVATPDNEQELIEYALAYTTSKVEARCRQMRNVQSSSVDEARHAHNQRSLRCFRDREHQMMSITVDLPAETGELVMVALDKAMMDQSLDAAPNDPEQLSSDQQADNDRGEGSLGRAQADALVSVLQAYVTQSTMMSESTHGSGQGSSEDSKDAASYEQGNDEAASKPGSSSAYHVVLHVDQAALTAGAANSAEKGTKSSILDTSRSDLPVETMHRICCDTAVTHMLDGPAGQPLSVGRKTRVVPTHIKKALWSRDGGCRYPGCHNTRFVDAHHVQHWSAGGETSVDNLMLLCTRHHRLVHEEGYRIHTGHDGAWFFMRPDGRAVPETGYQIADVVDDMRDISEVFKFVDAVNTRCTDSLGSLHNPSREGANENPALANEAKVDHSSSAGREPGRVAEGSGRWCRRIGRESETGRALACAKVSPRNAPSTMVVLRSLATPVLRGKMQVSNVDGGCAPSTRFKSAVSRSCARSS